MRTLNVVLILLLFVLVQDGTCSTGFLSDIGQKVKETVYKGWVAVGFGKQESYDVTRDGPTTQVTTVERYIKKNEEDHPKTTLNASPTTGKSITSANTNANENVDERHAMHVGGACPDGNIKSRSGICMPAQNGGNM